MAPPFLHCKSHPDRLLTEHLLDVANRLEGRVGKRGSPLWVAGLCHDLGKATSFFQDYLCPGWRGDPYLKAHSLFGAFWVAELLTREDDNNAMLAAALHMAFVRSHHGRLDDLREALAIKADEEERLEKRVAATEMDGIAAWLREQLDGQPVSIPTFNEKPLATLRRKLDPTFRSKVEPDFAMHRFQTALRDFGWLIAADRESAAGESPDSADLKAPPLDRSHVDRFRANGDFGSSTVAVRLATAREAVYRAAITGANQRPAAKGNLWTLQVPTGAGKTLAALGWATERRRLRELAGHSAGAIFYALPFTSIIDQTAAVIRRLWPQASELGALAVHHHLADYGAAEEQREEGAGKREWAEAWRADVVCTTFVQIVHALFHGTTADARRFAALTQGGVLILDEAQALKAELWPTLRVALRALTVGFGVDVLLLTATVPALFTEGDAPTNISPADLGTVFDRYDVHIERPPEWNAARLIDAAAHALTLQDGMARRSGLLLLNTVNAALAVHALARQEAAFSGLPLFHLSTNLRPKDRERILREVGSLEKAGQPRLLIATQVVEAGVDLSFDVVFRAQAPLDAIVQAAGRCNRHGAGPRGEVRVFPFASKSAHQIYGDIKMGAALDTLEALASEFAKRPVPEPVFSAKIPEFFRRVADNDGEAKNKLRAVLQAVTALEFAALRGEPERTAKHVELIAEDGIKVPVFIETDDDDAAVWKELMAAHAELDPRHRRLLLRKLRAKVGARVVEVPQHLNPPPLAATVPLAHVSQSEASSFYDLQTGWRRPLPENP